MKKLVLASLFSLFIASPAFAVVSLTFAGGNGAPLSITIPTAITFTLTGTAANGAGPAFVFDGVGDSFVPAGIAVSGNIVYTVNGTAGATLNRLGSGTAANDVTADDEYLLPSTQPGISAIGNTVTLSAGTLTSTANFAGAPPAAGSYNAFIARSSNGTRISTLGAAVPEPGSLLLLGVAVGCLALRKRRA